jgi:hypothetical protein
MEVRPDEGDQRTPNTKNDQKKSAHRTTAARHVQAAEA